ncbi:hypothetical protein Taro_009015 [Colocasia esculenta]|uniref:Uncharacterized protein n=1 Tax=Colocasia esculenta TaxID=4460 RepID=A0A843U2U3_COLES|nr:hypothetical protein [Colocasia esculenta]
MEWPNQAGAADLSWAQHMWRSGGVVGDATGGGKPSCACNGVWEELWRSGACEAGDCWPCDAAGRTRGKRIWRWVMELGRGDPGHTELGRKLSFLSICLIPQLCDGAREELWGSGACEAGDYWSCDAAGGAHGKQIWRWVMELGRVRSSCRGAWKVPGSLYKDPKHLRSSAAGHWFEVCLPLVLGLSGIQEGDGIQRATRDQKAWLLFLFHLHKKWNMEIGLDI